MLGLMAQDRETSERTISRHLSFDRMRETADSLKGVRSGDLEPGDRVIVETRNSVYSIWAWTSSCYIVSGGWYDKTGQSPKAVKINGCTFGGSVICADIIAAPGLFLEFSDHVKTTRIQRVTVVRVETSDRLH